MAVTSWSHSKLVDFERCKRMFWLKHDKRVPEPIRPLPQGKLEHANDRGSRIHESCELYVKGHEHVLTPEAEKHFGPQLDLLRVLHGEGMVSLEGEWGHDKNWNPCDWRQAWLRLKLDAMVHWSKTEATVIDHKTGKKWGNEIKHDEQLKLYMLAAFLRFPHLEVVHSALWYLDLGEITERTYTRDQGLRFKDGLHKRGLAVTSCSDFPPNPNLFSCQWCYYGQRPDGSGTGDCDKGVWK